MNITEPTPINHGFWNCAGAEMKVMMVCEKPSRDNGSICFNKPEIALDFWRKNVARARWYDPDKEACVVLCLDIKHNVKVWNLISLGTATASLVHPREVFRPVIAASATACVLMHNHPSGDPAPSQADRDVTAQMNAAAVAVDIELLDHIIVGSPARDPLGRGIYSFNEEYKRMRAEQDARWSAENAARREARKQVRLARKRAKETAAA